MLSLSTLKTFLYGLNSSLPPIRTDDGSVTFKPSKTAEFFLLIFQNKHNDQELGFPATCFPKPKFTYFAFKSSEIKYYLKDLNPHGGLDLYFLYF